MPFLTNNSVQSLGTYVGASGSYDRTGTAFAFSQPYVFPPSSLTTHLNDTELADVLGYANASTIKDSYFGKKNKLVSFCGSQTTERNISKFDTNISSPLKRNRLGAKRCWGVAHCYGMVI